VAIPFSDTITPEPDRRRKGVEAMARSVKQLSIRLPEPLYCEVAALSQQRGESMNQLVIAGLKRVIEQGL
jgi:predicted HicB family RNase H-like nuclease